MDIAVAGAACLVALGPDARCTRARIALAAVAPTPIRAVEAEAALEGKAPTPSLLQEAAEKAAAAARPITDVRGSAEYRRELVVVLARRALASCLQALGVKLG
jgi:carbon-monoxide dehydrogenase medium subunit